MQTSYRKLVEPVQVYPAGLFVIVVWLLCSLRDRDYGIVLVGALLPFGMLNVFKLGGFSFIADDFVAAATCMLFAVNLLIRRPRRIEVPAIGILLILLAIYGLITSFFFIRLFAGQIEVFVFNRLYDGVRVSPYFSGTILPLGPTSANISQYAYLLLDIGFFFLAYAVAKARGPEFLLRGLRIGAVINLGLGLIDLAGGGPMLSIIKTADYALLDNHSISGISRVVGGFSEASAFGQRTATFAAFFLTYGVLAGSRKDSVIGLASGFMALLALSTSSVIGIAVILLFFVARFVSHVTFQFEARRFYMSAFFVLVIILFAFVGLTVNLSDPQGLIYELADRLIFSKVDSRSGMERGAMAMSGLNAFFATWGLGAGIGSVMANGHGAAILAAVGLPGMIMIMWFYYATFLRRIGRLPFNDFCLRRAAQCYFLAALSISLASSFSVSPGLSTMFIAAISLVAAGNYETHRKSS